MSFRISIYEFFEFCECSTPTHKMIPGLGVSGVDLVVVIFVLNTSEEVFEMKDSPCRRIFHFASLVAINNVALNLTF